MPSRPRRVVLAIVGLAVSTLVALALAEWLAGLALRTPAERRAIEQGIPWERRDRLDLIVEARRTDSNWFPAVPANAYLERAASVGGRVVIPLGGVANANVIGCNENGYYTNWRTDEFGFSNPAGALASRGPHLVFIGDSYAQGDCLKSDETIVGRVRAVREKTVNLGNGGNGPLLELAGIREYVSAGSVSYAFWMYYEGNDLADLRRDRANPILARYLEPGFSQGLRAIRGNLDAAVRELVNARFEAHLQSRPRVFPKLRALVWEARNSGFFLGTPLARKDEAMGDDGTLALFGEVLRTARDEVAAKGGRLVFVYLPESYRYAGPALSEGASQREEVLKAVRELGIPIVDIHAAFSRHADPLELFPFGLKVRHYNRAGAKVVADEILRFLSTHPAPEPAA